MEKQDTRFSDTQLHDTVKIINVGLPFSSEQTMKFFLTILDQYDSTSRAGQRMAFSGFSFLLVFLLAPEKGIVDQPWVMGFVALTGVYFVVAVLEGWLISNRNANWQKIEFPCFFLDLPVMALGLAVAGPEIAIMSPLLAMVTLIRGVRYGPIMLASHVSFSLVVFVLLYLYVPFWTDQTYLVLANLFLLLLLPVQFYGVSVNIERKSRRLKKENLTDPLTKSLNRKALQTSVRRLLHEKQPFVLCFLDLDHFKMVNDTLGHATGDKLLQRVCAKLNMRLREEDRVYRLAGDEFVVLSEGVKLFNLAESLGQRVHAAIAEAIAYTCPALPVSSSVGVLLVDGTQEVRCDDLIAEADQLMYQAKKAGKNQVVVKISGS